MVVVLGITEDLDSVGDEMRRKGSVGDCLTHRNCALALERYETTGPTQEPAEPHADAGSSGAVELKAI